MTEIFPPLAVGYDVETYPNCFTCSYALLSAPDVAITFEISFRKNQLPQLIEWLEWCRVNRIEMYGFKNLDFDYPLLDWIYRNPHLAADPANIYARAQQLIQNDNKFGNVIWENQRIAPQVDVYKIHHFDNVAKFQSLKGVEFNMRSELVQELPIAVGTFLTAEQIDNILIPYNQHDVRETIKFVFITSGEIKLRREMRSQLNGDVMNFNSTKLGKQLLEQRLGEERTHTRGPNGKRMMRQTPREVMRVKEFMFPYLRFEQPEFQRVHRWLWEQEIRETKGVFKDLSATVGGFTIHYGTGGIHGSVTSKAFYADADYAIEDIDVKSLYPRIAVVNKLYPLHLGPEFVPIYEGIINERAKHAKGTSANAALKLAGNGSYGASNDKFSTLYDPQFTMTITINGQLLLSMLAEWLMTVPSLRLIQANTDGMTYYIDRRFAEQARGVCRAWEFYTGLELEYARYARMYIRDVSSYIGVYEDAKKAPKLKGAYKFYDSADEISNDSPPAWHKDLSSAVIQRAAVAQMLDGYNVETFIHNHQDAFNFLLRGKVDKRSTLYIGDTVAGNLIRYYVAKDGKPLRKNSPPTGAAGTWKRRSKITDEFYAQVSATLAPGQWDERIHTSNKSVYEEREIGFVAGWNVALCNHMRDFSWQNLNHQYYVEEAKKLIIT